MTLIPGSPSDRMAVHRLIGKTFLLLDNQVRQYLRRFDLTLPEFSVLAHLEEGASLTISELSLRVICDKSVMTRMIDRLEARGLVRRERAAGRDRRLVQVYLTPAGAELRQVAVAAHADLVDGLYKGLTWDELETLQALLAKLSAAVEPDSPADRVAVAAARLEPCGERG